MIPAVPNDDNGFGFGEVIDLALEGYLSRPAIESEIRDRLQSHNPCVVIVGEPGSGKTSLAARLIRSGNYIHYFLRSGHTEFNLWRDPHAFYTSIGFQLKARYSDDIFPQAVVFDVRGNVKDVDEGGSFVGAEIQHLAPVPWHSTALNVKIKAGSVRGNAVGVKIEQVAEDYRRVPLTAYRQMALIDPLRRLKRIRPGERVVLWIDGLDEEAEAQTGGTHVADSIAGSLPLIEELALLGNLALVISSRPGVLLDRFFQNGAREINLHDPCFREDNGAVVCSYIDRQLAMVDIRRSLQQAGETAAAVREKLVNGSGNNFLYLRHFFEGVRDGEVSGLLEGGLPAGLDSIYVRLLGRITRALGAAYFTDYHPFVSVLAVAGRALTAQQLQQFSGLDQNRVKTAVARLRPFLDTRRISHFNIYSLYHKSFRDCLTDKSHSDESWYVDHGCAHSKIAQFYLRDGAPVWEQIDDYAFDFLTIHLSQSSNESRQLLPALLNEHWRQAKRKHYRSNRQFEQDLAIAAVSVRHLPFPRDLIATARLGLMQSLVAEIEGQLPENALELMARLGQVQRAFDCIHSGLDAGATINRLAQVIRGLRHSGAAGAALQQRAVRQGLKFIGKEPDHALLANLLEALPADAELADLLPEIISLFNSGRAYWATPSALSEIARLHTEVNRNDAANLFQQGLDAVNRLTNSSRGLELCRIFRYWACFDAEGARTALANCGLPVDAYTAETVLNVARAFERTGHPGELRAAHELVAQNLLPWIADPFKKALSLSTAAAVELELGDAAQATASIGSALAAVDLICGADDPEATSQSRPGQKTTARIHVAAVAMEADAVHGVKILESAWESLESNGFWETGEALATLVNTQYRQNAGLLSAHIERISEIKLRAELRIAAGLANGDKDRTAAEAQLEEALMESEIPSSHCQSHEEFCLGIVHALGPRERVASQALLEKSHVTPEAIVSWRLKILRHLATGNDPEAASWLKETLRWWTDSVKNTHFICEFPSVVRELPLPIVQLLGDEAPGLHGAVYRALLSAAVGAALAVVDKKRGAALLEAALGSLNSASTDPPGLAPHLVLAFVAGQWWQVDSELAQRLWIDALARLETDPFFAAEPHIRSTHLLDMVSNLRLGAPRAALCFLLSYSELPNEPGTLLTFVFPAPGVPVHLAAGMCRRDYLLSLELAYEARQSGSVRTQIVHWVDPGVRALAACTAAQTANDASLDERMLWCETALNAAHELKEDYMQCLLSSDVAHAFYAIGAKRRAIELAQAIARNIIEKGQYYESIYRKPAYTYAVGRSLQLVAADREANAVTAMVWDARCLRSGYGALLGYLAPVIAEVDPDTLPQLQIAEQEARCLFSRSSKNSGSSQNLFCIPLTVAN